jgi:hypothetical protein
MSILHLQLRHMLPFCILLVIFTNKDLAFLKCDGHPDVSIDLSGKNVLKALGKTLTEAPSGLFLRYRTCSEV